MHKKQGRPKFKDIDEMDILNINIKLSFNQVRKLVYRFKNCTLDSVEGEVSQVFVKSLRDHVKDKVSKGILPKEYIDLLMGEEDID